MFVVDTSVWVEYFRGVDLPLVERGLREGSVFLSPVVASELLSGRLAPKQRMALIDFLEELPLCDSALDHWLRAGSLRSQLRAKGLNVSTPDVHIAQCCLDLDCGLLTRDLIFQKIGRVSPLRVVTDR